MNEKSTPPAPLAGSSARTRDPSAVCQTVFHIVSLLACIVAIGAAAYTTAQAKGDEKTIMIGTFLAAFWTCAVDITEIAAFLDRWCRGLWRCPERFLYLLELVTAVFCFGLPAASMLAQNMVRYERCRYVRFEDEEREGCRNHPGPMDGGQMVGFATIYIVATIHTIMFAMHAVQCCIRRRKSASAEGVMG